MRDVEIEFSDGKITCLGDVRSMDDAEMVSADEHGIWERTTEVAVTVVDQGVAVMHNGDRIPIEPGEYTVNPHGLYRHDADEE